MTHPRVFDILRLQRQNLTPAAFTTYASGLTDLMDPSIHFPGNSSPALDVPKVTAESMGVTWLLLATVLIPRYYHSLDTTIKDVLKT
jgi:hypothetical protein